MQSHLKSSIDAKIFIQIDNVSIQVGSSPFDQDEHLTRIETMLMWIHFVAWVSVQALHFSQNEWSTDPTFSLPIPNPVTSTQNIHYCMELIATDSIKTEFYNDSGNKCGLITSWPLNKVCVRADEDLTYLTTSTQNHKIYLNSTQRTFCFSFPNITWQKLDETGCCNVHR